nr:hypothetical protein [Tanacetum cinerariifolium]
MVLGMSEDSMGSGVLAGSWQKKRRKKGVFYLGGKRLNSAFAQIMATTIKQQVALDDALVPNTQRLRIKRSNFLLPSDIQSKESTLQLVYDVLRRCPFFKAFLVTADVPEIYMEMLHICPRILGQAFAELPFEEEILEFIRFLGHDFVYQVEQKNQKKSNEMYYPRFTKVFIHHFMSKDPSIPRRNKINWHYVRDDSIFSTIKVVSKRQNSQQYGAMLPVELTNDEIMNTKAYKKYYAFATGEASPKPKAISKRKRSGLDTSINPLIATTTPTTIVAVTPKLTAAAKGKQPAKAKSLSDPSEVARTEVQQLKIVLRRSRQQTHISQPGGSGTDEGTGSKPGVPDVATDESEEEEDDDDDEDKNGDERDDDDQDQEIAKHDDKDDTKESGNVDEEGESDEEDYNEETREEESFDPIPQTPKSSEDEEELYRDVNIHQGRGIQATLDVEDSHVTLTPVHPDGQQESLSISSHFVTSMLNPPNDAGMESIFATASSSAKPLQTSTPIMTPSTIATIITISHALFPPKTILSEVLQNIPTFDSVFPCEDRLKSLEASFSEYIQTNPFAEAVSNIPDRGSKRQRDGKEPESASAPFETAIKSAGRSTAGSKSRADYQPIVQSSQHPEWFSQPKKPLTPDRDWNKTLPAVQGSTQTWISELAKQADSRSSFNELLDTPVDFSKFIMNWLRVDTLTPELLAGPTFELMKGSCTSLIDLEYHLEEVYKATTDQLDRVNPEGQQYPHNLLQPLSLIPDNRGRRVIPFAHFINNDLEYLRGGASSLKYTTLVMKTKAADYGQIKWIEDLVPRTMWIQEPIDYDKHALWGVSHWGWKRQQFYGFAVNRESALDVYSKRRIIAVTDLKIVEWHSYKHLDGLRYVVTMTSSTSLKKAILRGYISKTSKICCYFLYKESCLI